MNCPHCGKEVREKEIHVKRLDRDVYINGDAFCVLGVEPLTETKKYPAYKRHQRTKPPIIVYVEAE